MSESELKERNEIINSSSKNDCTFSTHHVVWRTAGSLWWYPIPRIDDFCLQSTPWDATASLKNVYILLPLYFILYCFISFHFFSFDVAVFSPFLIYRMLLTSWTIYLKFFSNDNIDIIEIFSRILEPGTWNIRFNLPMAMGYRHTHSVLFQYRFTSWFMTSFTSHHHVDVSTPPDHLHQGTLEDLRRSSCGHFECTLTALSSAVVCCMGNNACILKIIR